MGVICLTIVDMLMQFNLTKQEAMIYLILLAEGSCTGYEIAKLSGISRSNIYTSLSSLVDKGAANLIEGAAARYAAVPPEEFCGNRIRELRGYTRELLCGLPKRDKDTEGYITISGERQIFHKMKNMIGGARERIYISVADDVMQTVLEELRVSLLNGIKLVVITDKPPALEGAAIYLAETPRSQIRLITDSACVLTGDIEFGEASACLFSRKRNLVDLFKDALKNEIKVIEYERRRGD